MTHKQPTLSIRIDLPGGGRIGPGKIALLKAVQQKGSIRQAATLLEMSYPRALKLIEELNMVVNAPVIITHQGGARRGGAQLTKTGEGLIAAYDQLCKQSASNVRREMKAIKALLR